MSARYTTYNLDCRDVMDLYMDENSVDAIVTDPPYGLSFMGKAWDHGVPGAEFWVRALRVLKPGGHLLAFGGSRTYHRMASAVEDAGFEIRDQIMWVYGSGFPKSHNGHWGGTALKPAHEPIVMARKPLVGTVAANVLAHGTGALNIDGCRVGLGDDLNGGRYSDNKQGDDGNSYGRGINERSANDYVQPAGRWPANLIHDGSDEVLAGFPVTKSGGYPPEGGQRSHGSTYGLGINERGEQKFTSSEGSEGSAARFFYCAKASKRDRDEGLEGFEKRVINVTEGHGRGAVNTSKGGDGLRENRPRANTHPTVKPTDLMAYLCRLVTPPGGTVLDPFMGSGSTGKAALREGFKFIGCELDAAYHNIAEGRLLAESEASLKAAA